MSNKKILAYSLLILFVFLSSCSNGTTSGPVIETRITGYVINPNIPEDEHDEVYNSTVTVTSNLGTYTSVPSENSNFFDIMGIEHNGSFTITVSVEGFPDYSYSEVVTTEETEILEKTLELDTTEYIYLVRIYLSSGLSDLYGNSIDENNVTFSSNNAYSEDYSNIYLYHNGSFNVKLTEPL